MDVIEVRIEFTSMAAQHALFRVVYKLRVSALTADILK